MVAMAVLVYLPRMWMLSLSIAVILVHDCLDPINANQFGPAGWAWNLLHQPGVFMGAGVPVLVTYTFVPWIAVMAAGFCFGEVMVMDPLRRSRIMLRLGFSCAVGFLIIRSINAYGDPVPWSHHKSATFTVLSFLNCTKYPASLDFLLMTLGPALIVLAYLDRRSFKSGNPLLIFGRVPLFYFVLHFYAIHALVVVMSWFRYGKSTLNFTFSPLVEIREVGGLHHHYERRAA